MYRFIILCFISILFVACGQYEAGRSDGLDEGYDEGQQEAKYCYTCGEYIY